MRLGPGGKVGTMWIYEGSPWLLAIVRLPRKERFKLATVLIRLTYRYLNTRANDVGQWQGDAWKPLTIGIIEVLNCMDTEEFAH